MFFTSKIFYHWHRIRLAFLELLIEGCVDQKIKNKLKSKINYHKQKMREYQKTNFNPLERGK
ncbi:hypothetical protein CN981_00205 [Priestia megaterium]|nr:hypothetical protein CN981_00205 [Priestia megaterium]